MIFNYFYRFSRTSDILWDIPMIQVIEFYFLSMKFKLNIIIYINIEKAHKKCHEFRNEIVDSTEKRMNIIKEYQFSIYVKFQFEIE